MDDFFVKKVEVEDVLILREVAIKAYSDHYLDLWHDHGEWYLNKYFSTEQLTVEINDPNSRFFIAFSNGKAVGFLKLNINAELELLAGESALELERIYINKEATGKGIGKELAALATTIAKENNKEIIWLKAMDTSEGPIAFYKKMGFEVKGTHRLKHTLMKEELRGMVIMVKEIKA